jgi:hypothetical protein
MEILSEQELGGRLDYLRPLKDPSEVPEKAPFWCIPFEYGANVKGTRISLNKAKVIAAELIAAVAVAEQAEIFRAFKLEQERVKALDARLAEKDKELWAVQTERNILKGQLQSAKKNKKGKR